MTNGHLLWLTVIYHLCRCVCPSSAARYDRCIPILWEFHFPHLAVCLLRGTRLSVVRGSLCLLYLNILVVLLPILSNHYRCKHSAAVSRACPFLCPLSEASPVVCIVNFVLVASSEYIWLTGSVLIWLTGSDSIWLPSSDLIEITVFDWIWLIFFDLIWLAVFDRILPSFFYSIKLKFNASIFYLSRIIWVIFLSGFR